MKDSNYWKNFSIRNIDDFNTYAAYVIKKKRRKLIGLSIIAAIEIAVAIMVIRGLLILAYCCLTR
jgi:hypothetical protein